ncbi:MAG: hypothetical protein M3040_06685 [Bacteroidota bacterium]|nr:hypothetical protein [Bacteroidota bacterium]
MDASTNPKETNQEPSEDKQQRDAERIETNKTDPQKTELKGFFDSKEPLEEDGTINPITGNPKEPE